MYLHSLCYNNWVTVKIRSFHAKFRWRFLTFACKITTSQRLPNREVCKKCLFFCLIIFILSYLKIKILRNLFTRSLICSTTKTDFYYTFTGSWENRRFDIYRRDLCFYYDRKNWGKSFRESIHYQEATVTSKRVTRFTIFHLSPFTTRQVAHLSRRQVRDNSLLI